MLAKRVISVTCQVVLGDLWDTRDVNLIVFMMRQSYFMASQGARAIGVRDFHSQVQFYLRHDNKGDDEEEEPSSEDYDLYDFDNGLDVCVN